MAVTEVISKNLSFQEVSTLFDVAQECAFLAMLVRKPQLIHEARRRVPLEWIHGVSSHYIYKCMDFVATKAMENNWEVGFDVMSMLRVANSFGPDWANRLRQNTNNMGHVHTLMVMAETINMSEWEATIAHLQDIAIRVQLYNQARAAQLAAMDKANNQDAHKLVMSVESYLLGLAYDNTQQDQGIRKLSDGLVEWNASNRMAFANPGRDLLHVRCPGFPKLMEMMGGGFRRKGLGVIVARPKKGKSTLLQAFGLAAAVLDQTPTLILDTEMSNAEYLGRSIASQSNEWLFDLEKAKHLRTDRPEMKRRVDEACARLKQAPIYYCAIAGKSIEYAVSLMNQFSKHQVGTEEVDDGEGHKITVSKPALVIYDWIKIPGNSSRGAEEWQMIGDLCQKLKDAASRLNLAVMAGAQGNRKAIGKTGKEFAAEAEDFVAGSDRIAQFCTLLCCLRDVDQNEERKILDNRWVRDGNPGNTDHNNLWFNQALHIMLNRFGPAFTSGIPMYIHRGKAQYQEMAYRFDYAKGEWEFDSRKHHVELAFVDFLRYGGSSKKADREFKKSGLDPGTIADSQRFNEQLQAGVEGVDPGKEQAL